MDRGKLEHYVDCVLVTSQQQGSPSKVDEALADANAAIKLDGAMIKAYYRKGQVWRLAAIVAQRLSWALPPGIHPQCIR